MWSSPSHEWCSKLCLPLKPVWNLFFVSLQPCMISLADLRVLWGGRHLSQNALSLDGKRQSSLGVVTSVVFGTPTHPAPIQGVQIIPAKGTQKQIRTEQFYVSPFATPPPSQVLTPPDGGPACCVSFLHAFLSPFFLFPNFFTPLLYLRSCESS